MTRKPKLCITSPMIYPLFNPECQTSFGGWDVRVALIAKELARCGDFQVNLIVADHGQPHIEQRVGVTLFSWVGREIWGVPSPKRLAVAVPRNPSLWKRGWGRLRTRATALKRKFVAPPPLAGQVGRYIIAPEMISIYDEVDADIYMVPGNSQLSGEAVFYCRQRGKKYAFLAGSDFDYYAEYKLQPDQIDMYGAPHALKVYAIQNADAHIVQNERQAKLLWEGYNRTCTIIQNPIDTQPLFPRNLAATNILWVGKSDERVKRPSIVLELARQLPEYSFVVIMNFAMQETHAECIARAQHLPNVTLIERVPFAQIEGYFANARLHLGTSLFEGFPNTFLQAAKYGVPTVSIQVDPGGMLAEHGAGMVCGGDFEKLKESVRVLMSDGARYVQLSRDALAYVRAFHDKDVVIPKYEQVLNSVFVRSR